MISVSLKKKLSGAFGIINLDISFSVSEGGIYSFFGDSGAGKTSVLRMFSGLTLADEGFVSVSGNIWYDSKKKTSLPPYKRRAAFVFQDYNLFPNMNVYENVMYMARSKEEAERLLGTLGLFDLKEQNVCMLSGGQKSRVAFARALASVPSICILDEPFSAIDDKMRSVLYKEIKRYNEKYKTTFFFVSHEAKDHFILSEKVFRIEDGVIAKEGDAAKIFLPSLSSNKFAFFGEILRIEKADLIYIAYVSVSDKLVEIVLSEDEGKRFTIGEKVLVGSKAFNPVIRKIS